MDHTAIIRHQQEFFRSGKTMAAGFRRERLLDLRAAIEAHEKPLLDALYADLRKNPHEAYAAEIGYTLGEIRHALRHLDRWIRPQRRKAPWLAWPATAEVRHVPLGVALIIGPWNYPLQLLLTPLVSAIAAGNTAVLKPSELAPHSSGVIAGMIRRCFQPEFAAVIEGGRETSEALLAQKFDKIFFTGSTAIGRKVMAAAARHLTPVTLELGGKSPCIVAADAPVETTARRIVWGKFMNAGQTCVAPDFVVAHRNVAAGLVDAMKSTLREFYGDDPQLSADYGRIINQHHFKRLMALLDGGHPDAAHPDTAPDAAHPDAAHPDAADLYIAPTILQDVSWDSPLMQDEIFGPILPVMVYDDIDELLCKLRDMPPPLALYLFTNHRALREKVLAGTRSGGVCVNDTISHIIGRDLPFGGVGDSGMGSYHGRAGFECFSHQRAVMRRRSGIDPDFRYPPPKAPLAMLKKIMRWFG